MLKEKASKRSDAESIWASSRRKNKKKFINARSPTRTLKALSGSTAELSEGSLRWAFAAAAFAGDEDSASGEMDLYQSWETFGPASLLSCVLTSP